MHLMTESRDDFKKALDYLKDKYPISEFCQKNMTLTMADKDFAIIDLRHMKSILNINIIHQYAPFKEKEIEEQIREILRKVLTTDDPKEIIYNICNETKISAELAKEIVEKFYRDAFDYIFSRLK